MTTVDVRRFAPADADAVAALWREAFPGDPGRNEPRGMIARKLARDPDLFWVAEDGGHIVGALMAGYDGVRGWLYHLAVAPEHRRNGTATALVERAVHQLHTLGCRKVNLQVRGTNLEVRAFYEALGWSEDNAVSLGRVLPDHLAPRGQ